MRANMRIWVTLSFGFVAGCKGYDSYDYLDGKFITKDLTQIDLLAPSDKSTSSKSPKFVWAKRSGASKYLLELSTSASYATIVLSRTTTDATYTLVDGDLSGITTLDAFSYYWRVTAIYPDQQVASGSFVFHVLADAIVYVNGSSTATEQVGNKSFPLKTIQSGIENAHARRNGVLATTFDVYVAAGNYSEEVTLRPRISIRGGYESSGWVRNVNNNVASISAPSDVAVRGNASITAADTDTTAVDGFTINGLGSSLVSASGISLVNASPLIMNNVINGGAAGTTTTTGILLVGGSAPRILNNLISGGSGGSSYGVDTQNSSPIITNNTISGGTASSSFRFGIRIGNGSVTITNNIIYSGTGGSNKWGVYENNGTSNPLSFENNLIFDCSNGLYFDDATMARTTGPELIITGNTTDSGPTLGNLTIANFAAVSFQSSTDLHLTASTPAAVRTGGKDTSQSTCGSTGTSSCGNVTTDRDGLSRTVPYSIGAYEY